MLEINPHITETRFMTKVILLIHKGVGTMVTMWKAMKLDLYYKM
jgi:hypothetical protein